MDPRLLAVLARIDDGKRPVAELNRQVGVAAEAIGVPRPSYEHVRRTVRLMRARLVTPGVGEVLLEIMFRSKPPEALVDVLAGTAPLRPRRS